ncbi:MAG: ribonuclease H-like domain-containing protein [Candidatus Krumholzibacteriia bacterium]
MDLRRRLARLDGLTRRPQETPRPAGGAPACGPAALGLVDDPRGGPWRRRVRVDLPPPPGLPDLAGLLPPHWLQSAAPGDLLFLDTETTGLAGGTGTLAFLVGLAWWEDGALRVEQHFLPGPEHEDALLAAVAAAAADRRVVVSFNGASFDWPLLRTRALLNRRPDPLAHLAGWDLLVPARRLWGRLLPDCRQQTLETEICGLVRGPGDIPGERIPQAWFDFLAGGDPAPVGCVLTHNLRDMEGMARVLLAVAEAAAGLGAPPPAAPAPDWRLAWACGRICERRRDHAAAAAWLALAAAADRNEQRLLADAVRVLKRLGEWEAALALVERALAAEPRAAWLHREAAIIWEHRLGDPQKALAHARLTGDHRRIARLERRRLSCRPRGEEP